MNSILYLHGFNSSPASYKARVLQGYMRSLGLEDFIDVPAIPPEPAEAIDLLQRRVEKIIEHTGLCLVGSSLGGFYATWLAEKYGCPAVLINPAVRPHQLLEQYLGRNTNDYTAESWILDQTHIEQFRQLFVENITQPHRYLLMLQTGDETLDYREATDKYRECPSIIEEGGSHEFSGFDRYLEKIVSFCRCTSSPLSPGGVEC